jgi:hypothetical protein
VVDFKIQVDDEEEKQAPEEQAPSKPAKKRSGRPSFKLGKMSRKTKLYTVLVVAAILLVGFFIQMNRIERLREENARLSDPQKAAQLEADRITAELRNLIELPDETPTVATVVDVEKLSDQPFFANAQNGDKVLLFPENKKAILYRPSTKKIVEVAPINLGDQQGGDSSTSESIKAEDSSGGTEPATE